MKEEKSCGAIIINDGKVLIIKQNDGTIGFPKGHMESGETEEKTALREVKEETNLDIVIDNNKRYEMSYIIERKNVLKKVVLYLAYAKNPNAIFKQDSELEFAKWIDIQDVYDTLNYEDTKLLWQQVIDEIK